MDHCVLNTMQRNGSDCVPCVPVSAMMCHVPIGPTMPIATRNGSRRKIHARIDKQERACKTDSDASCTIKGHRRGHEKVNFYQTFLAFLNLGMGKYLKGGGHPVKRVVLNPHELAGYIQQELSTYSEAGQHLRLGLR